MTVFTDKGFRNATLSLAVKTIRLRYKNSLLGVFWSMLNPLLFLLILWLVFREVSHMERYTLYVLSGLIFWNFLSSGILQVLTSFVDNGSIIKSIPLSPICFPWASGLAALFHLLLSLVPFFVLMFFVGYEWDVMSFLFFIPMLVVSLVFVVGFGMFMATFNVFFRDIQMLWSTILPAFFYFTPIAYAVEMVPESSRHLLQYNPFFHFLEAYHAIFYRSEIPSIRTFLICVACAGFSYALGYAAYKRFHHGFISNI